MQQCLVLSSATNVRRKCVKLTMICITQRGVYWGTDRTDMCHTTYFGHCAADRYCWVRDCMSTIRTQCHTSIAPLNITAVTGCHKLHIAVLTVRSHKQISKTHTTPRLTASVLSHYPAHTCYLLMYELRAFRSHPTANTRPVCHCCLAK